jgi:hypothetical protein
MTKLWQEVPDDRGANTERMRVPGGWVVRSRVTGGVGMCFVPDHYAQSPGGGPMCLDRWELPGEKEARLANLAQPSYPCGKS